MKLKTLTRLLYCYQFFLEFITIYAIEKIFFLESGVSILEIAVLNSLWGLSAFLLEIPTGILADHWDRKKMLVCAGLFLMMAYFFWFLMPHFWGFLLGLIFRSLSLAFSSGTAQAYIYDYLVQEGQQDQFEKIWGRFRAANLIGTGLAWMIGGYLSEVSSSMLLVLLSAGMGLLAASIAVFFPSVPKETNLEEKPYAFFKTTLQYGLRNPTILSVFLFSLLVWSCWFVTDEYWNVYLDWYGLSPTEFGLFIGLSGILGGFVGSFAHSTKKHSRPILYLGTLFLGAVFILASLFKSPLWLIPIFFLEGVMALMLVLQESLLQHHADPKRRATLASLSSLIKEFGIITGLFFGWLWHFYDINLSFTFFGVIILLYLPLDWLLVSRKATKNSTYLS